MLQLSLLYTGHCLSVLLCPTQHDFKTILSQTYLVNFNLVKPQTSEKVKTVLFFFGFYPI